MVGLVEDCPYAGMGCQQGQAKCQVGGPGLIPRKRMQEEVSPGEGPSKRVCRPRDGGSGGGADIGLFLEGVRSAPPEQTWLMWQMWTTHSAMESELRLLRQGMEYTFERVFWAQDGKQEGEWEGEREDREEHGVPEEVREEEETMR